MPGAIGAAKRAGLPHVAQLPRGADDETVPQATGPQLPGAVRSGLLPPASQFGSFGAASAQVRAREERAETRIHATATHEVPNRNAGKKYRSGAPLSPPRFAHQDFQQRQDGTPCQGHVS